MSCLKICGAGKSNAEDDTEARTNRKINDRNKKDFERDARIMKLLLLGPGESGKSTVFKQVNALFNNGYPEEERKKHKIIVYNNLYIGIKTLIKEAERLAGEGHPTKIISDEALLAQEIVEKIDYHDDLTPQIASSLLAVWRDKGIQEAWKRRSMFQLPFPLEYFFGKIDKLAQRDYIPSQDDVLRCRVRTTGIVELEFNIEQNKFIIIDVGGQRNERKKWIHCFDKVTAVIFVAAISEYDQVLYEDPTMNRLQEALDLFGEISGLKFFQNASIILFLNKIDLFQEKIKTVPLTECFKDYFGSMEHNAATNFIQDKFLAKARAGKKVFVHLTCATDSDLIRKVLLDVRTTILERDMGGPVN